MSDDSQKKLGPQMPFSNEAERGILSCLLHNPVELVPQAMSRMQEEWFYHPANRLLFAEILAMFQENKPVEYVALSQRLQDKKDEVSGVAFMEKIGGHGALAEILDFVPTPTHFGYYGKIVRDKWLLREVIRYATETVNDAYTYEAVDDIVPFITGVESRAFHLLQSAETGDERERPLPIATHLSRWLDEKEERWKNRGKMVGITTGIADLDRMLHGMDDREGEVVVVAGRPGMGKTAFGVSVLRHVAVTLRVSTAVFSIEMTANQLNDRLVLGGMQIDTSKGHSGMFSREEWKKLGGAEFEAVKSAPIWLDASSEINSADLRIRCQTLKRQHGIRFVLIDYVALVEAVGKEAKGDERLKIVEVMRTVAWIAKELKCVVMVLAQLNRETDRNRGKPPMLADLSGSASIEHTAHSILFLHRPVESQPWHRLSDGEKDEWMKKTAGLRKSHPECWGDGRKKDKLTGVEYGETLGWDTGRARQDWEEHALGFLAKNRRGPTNEIWLRYQQEYTAFVGRTPKLYSNNAEERQVG